MEYTPLNKNNMYRILCSFLLIAGLTQASFAQMNDGNYTFQNQTAKLTFTVSETGWKLTNVRFTNLKTQQVQIGTGYFRRTGDYAWYEFQTPTCNFSFDEPKTVLELSKYGCSDGSGSTEMKLNKAK